MSTFSLHLQNASAFRGFCAISESFNRKICPPAVRRVGKYALYLSLGLQLLALEQEEQGNTYGGYTADGSEERGLVGIEDDQLVGKIGRAHV